jgi:hypothetical protein
MAQTVRVTRLTIDNMPDPIWAPTIANLKLSTRFVAGEANHDYILGMMIRFTAVLLAIEVEVGGVWIPKGACVIQIQRRIGAKILSISVLGGVDIPTWKPYLDDWLLCAKFITKCTQLQTAEQIGRVKGSEIDGWQNTYSGLKLLLEA